MPSSSPLLEWCIVRLGQDMNWWVDEISDPIHWDVDGLGIIDPRQLQHIIDQCELLRDYGFDADIFENAFFSFRIERELADGRVRLIRTRESILDSDDHLFALPDILDDEKGPYADYLDMITRLRVKMLNDVMDFEQKLTVDELEEEVRERQNADYVDGRATHFFTEITGILEFSPDGFEADEDEEAGADDDADAEGDLGDFPDLDEDDEKIEEDETMKWDEDEEEEEEETEESLGDDEDEEVGDLGDDDDEEDEDEEEEEEEEEDGDDDEDSPPKKSAAKGRRR